MANLFVVYTPLQLLIAQQIVRQEKLTNNLLLESYFVGHKHFLDIFELTKIESCWDKTIIFDHNFAFWDFGGAKLLKNHSIIKKNYNEIKSILVDNHVKNIYLADFQNQSCRFTDVLFTNQGYNVIFFEEGYSHYIKRPGTIDDSISAKIKNFLIDTFYYLPIFHVKFAKWRSNPNRPYKGLPIYQRYSVIPGFHNEPYDKRLYCEPMVSEKLKSYLLANLNDNPLEKRVLLLSDPMTEVLRKQDRHYYFEILKESLGQIKSDEVLFIKYHPRDKEADRKKTEELVSSLNINFKVLSQEINVPIEYYLQFFKFSRIFFFNTSTYFYNGLLFPKTEFVKLLPVLHKKCLDNHVEHLEQMELLLDKMK